MKKVYKLIVPACFALLAISVKGQNAVSVPTLSMGGRHVVMKQNQLPKPSPAVQDVGKSFSNGVINYVFGDYEVGGYSSSSFSGWTPYIYVNKYFGTGDTTAISAENIHTQMANYVTVTYDTLWDYYTSAYHSPVLAGSVEVDTIWFEYVFHNTSHLSDTVVASVCGVTADGYPATSPVYGSDTMVFPPASNFTGGWSTDTIYEAWFILKTPIRIPASARHGWNFCTNLQFYGNKADTFGMLYESGYATCNVTPAMYETSGYTKMGVPDGRLKAVNSWVTGLYWFNDTKNGGNNTAMTWPTTTGSNPGACTNGTVTFFPGLYPRIDFCPDSNYYKTQDIWLSASITYTPATGINTMNAGGLSVGQNFPNPFNETTKISYSLTTSSAVEFNVYDITGRIIISSKYADAAPGEHTITMAASRFSPGIYFYSFNVNGYVVTKKMVITR